MIDTTKLLAALPPITAQTRDFWEGTRIGELRLLFGESGTAYFPEVPVDAKSLGKQLEWRKASGKGRLWSWVVMHKIYLDAFADAAPYIVAMVELDEGPMIISGLVGPLDQLACDVPVEVVFEKLDEQRALPKFRIA